MTTLILSVFFSISASADVVVVNGIYYDISGTTATVTQGGDYSGDLVIPESITFENSIYSVISIGYDAFWVFDGIIIHTVSVCISLSTVTACLCVMHDIMPIRAMIWMMTMSMTQSDMHEIELFLLSFCFMMFRFVY